MGADGGQCDAAGFRRQNQRHLAQVKMMGKFVGDVLHQLCVNAMVQKSVYLDDVAGQNLTLFENALLELLHSVICPFPVIQT